MKNEVYSLSEMEQRFKNYNLLLPQSTDVQISPFYSYHVEIVPCDTGHTSGDIFKVGTANTGRKGPDGKDIWADVYALTKPMLNKLAMAAGIQFNPDQTYGVRVDQYTYRAKAQGAMRKSDGTTRTETDQKEICLKDEEDKYRIEFMDKAANGITDEKQAKEAAKIFKGEYRRLKNKWGRDVQGYVIDPSERDRYIDRSVMVNMALLRKTWAEKAMTGAKLRVIRALLGLKGTYTIEELSRGFAIPTVVFSPDYSDPMIRQAMLTSGINGVTNMFGGRAPEVKQIGFSGDAPAMDVSADLDNPVFASDIVDDDFAEDYQMPGQPEEEPPFAGPDPAPVQEPPRQMQSRGASQGPDAEFQCDQCGRPINQNVYEFSKRRYGRPLCMTCQKGGTR